MKRDSENSLLDFCAEQRLNFSADAWAGFDAVSPIEKAAVARYLAGVEWYGQPELLTEFADSITPANFAELCRATGFDPSRFGGLLKARFAWHAMR